MALLHRRCWSPSAGGESPWYFPIRPLWEALGQSADFPDVATLNQLYQRALAGRAELPVPACTLRFAPAGKKPRRSRQQGVQLDTLYEGRIVLRGEVPTRAGDWHDFFNALSFAAFPRAKWALHERQYRLLAGRIGPGTQRLPAMRTREQDALALFDEGGIALVVLPEVQADLSPESRELDTLALALCQAHQARLVPFGHALYEHLVEGLPCPLGMLHAVRLDFRALAPAALIDALDLSLSRDLATSTLFCLPSPARGISLTAVSPDACSPGA